LFIIGENVICPLDQNAVINIYETELNISENVGITANIIILV
jgi:hypothetical protein